MEKTHFAIFDKSAGYLQWIGSYESAEAALAAFDSAVGIDPQGAGVKVDDWRMERVTADQASALETWQANGAPADECPLA